VHNRTFLRLVACLVATVLRKSSLTVRNDKEFISVYHAIFGLKRAEMRYLEDVHLNVRTNVPSPRHILFCVSADNSSYRYICINKRRSSLRDVGDRGLEHTFSFRTRSFDPHNISTLQSQHIPHGVRACTCPHTISITCFFGCLLRVNGHTRGWLNPNLTDITELLTSPLPISPVKFLLQ
jgi:hypothetical protein